MKKLIGLIAVFAFCIPNIFAQFSLTADISPRTELRHGYRVLPLPDEKPAFLINQRTRLISDFKTKKLSTRISFQDVRVWGQEPQKQPIPSLGLHEGWAELFFTDSLSLKIGRQEVVIDNQRFFANNDWIPQAQKHDMAMLKYISLNGEFTLATAFNQPWTAYGRNFTTDYGINNYKFLTLGRYFTKPNDNLSLSFLGVMDGYEFNDGNTYDPEIMHLRFTWSVYSILKAGGLNIMINPAIQHGKNQEGRELLAWYFRTDISGNLSSRATTTLGAEILSGNNANNSSNDKYGAFDFLYGAGHAHLGLMDYFTNLPAHTRGAGLVDVFLKNSIKTNSRSTFDAQLHLFFIQNNFIFEGETIDKYLGTELDLTYGYKVNDATSLLAGFSMMVGSESMEIINRSGTRGSKDEPAYFGYLMLRIRPKLFQQNG